MRGGRWIGCRARRRRERCFGLDAEGSELDIVQGAPELLEPDEWIAWINVEFTYRALRRDAATPWAVDEWLRGRGWRCLGVHSPAKNGEKADYVYCGAVRYNAIMDTIGRDSNQRKVDRWISNKTN